MADGDETVVIERRPAGPRFQLSLQPPRAPVAPEGRATVRLHIRNDDDEPTRYHLTLDGLPADWVRFDPLTAPVAPGNAGSTTILLQPGRHPAFPPGPYRLRLRVAPQRAPAAAREQEFTIRLLPGKGFGMALAQDGDALRLLLQNHGNAPLSLQPGVPAPVTAPDLAGGPLTLAAGEQRSIPLRLPAGARPLLGRRRTREFMVEVRSLDAAGFTAALPARLTATPRLDWRVIPLALALAAALLPALLAARPVTPVILDFHAGSSALARGATLELGWQVQDATALQLSLNGEPLEPPPDARQARLSLDTAELAGEITLLLEARNGDRRVSQSVTVTIHEPLQVEAFSATPTTLLRHVLQTLTLRWEVPGAQQVRIDGLAPATNREIAAGGARDGLAALPVLVDGALSLTLIAVDSYGNVLQQALTIPARPATCTVMSTTLGLRATPRAAAPVLTQPAFGADVEVDGRDPSGAWLRARTEGVSGWGRREGLRCAGFAPQDLRVLLPGRG